MTDTRLEEVIAQYFPGQTLASTFTGHELIEPDVPEPVDKVTVEGQLADSTTSDGGARSRPSSRRREARRAGASAPTPA